MFNITKIKKEENKKKKIAKNKQVFICEIIIITAIVIFAFFVNLVGTKKIPAKKTNFVSDLTCEKDVNRPGVKVGCLMGTNIGDYLKEKYENIEIKYFNTNDDVCVAVDAGTVDFGVGYDDICDIVASQYKNIKYLKDPIYICDSSFVFPKTDKGKKLHDDFNAYIEKIKASGVYDKIEAKWRSLDPKNYHFEPYNFTGENGTLNIVINATWEPMEFYYDGKFLGVYPELAYGFCNEYGYKPIIESADFAAELAGITTGKYDMMADIAEITPERLEVVYMSVPIFKNIEILYSHEPPTEMVEVPKYKVFFDTLKEGIRKNFTVDNRWKMFRDGLLITLALAVISAVFGTMLGIFICFLRMNSNPFFIAIAKIYIKIVQGTPIVVLLMIFNYIVFSNTGLSAFMVSVIGFSIDFSAYVSEIFRSGIEAVPSGQVKAAYALGFSKVSAFTKIVLPQALIYIIPVYSGQFISMVKMTSVAGYISVQDLTKVSDYIRSLTYEAFFPLITTAIIYFLLSSLLVLALRCVEKKIDPKLRSRKLKGVKE